MLAFLALILTPVAASTIRTDSGKSFRCFDTEYRKASLENESRSFAVLIDPPSRRNTRVDSLLDINSPGFEFRYPLRDYSPNEYSYFNDEVSNTCVRYRRLLSAPGIKRYAYLDVNWNPLLIPKLSGSNFYGKNPNGVSVVSIPIHDFFELVVIAPRGCFTFSELDDGVSSSRISAAYANLRTFDACDLNRFPAFKIISKSRFSLETRQSSDGLGFEYTDFEIGPFGIGPGEAAKRNSIVEVPGGGGLSAGMPKDFPFRPELFDVLDDRKDLIFFVYDKKARQVILCGRFLPGKPINIAR